MKRIGILTAGGDTPALNATLHGAASRANELKIELVGLLGGFNAFFDPRTPHVYLNPLFETIPELDSTVGGTVLGSSRRYLDVTNQEAITGAEDRVRRLGLGCAWIARCRLGLARLRNSLHATRVATVAPRRRGLRAVTAPRRTDERERRLR